MPETLSLAEKRELARQLDRLADEMAAFREHMRATMARIAKQLDEGEKRGSDDA